VPDDITPDDITPDDITPDDITPDDKDWTWVLREPCPECGFDASSLDAAAIGEHTRAMLPTWQAVLARPDAAVRRTPGLWSDLEYACHVRDVFRLSRVRLDLMLTEDAPQFANWDQDETALAERYDLQDPAVVATELVEAGAVLADAFDAVRPDQYERTGLRSDGALFTVDTFGRYVLHDPLHHLHDVGA
jgi:hypothetical protein